MRYGITFNKVNGFFHFYIHAGTRAVTVFPWSAKKRPSIILWNMEKHYPPEHYGHKGVFIGVLTSQTYPIYENE